MQTKNTKTKTKAKKLLLTGASGKLGIKILEIFLNMDYFVAAQCSDNAKKIKDFLKKNPQFKDKVEILEMDFEVDIPQIDKDITCIVNCASIFEEGNFTFPINLMKVSLINAYLPVALTSQFAKNCAKTGGNVINILDGNVYRYNEHYQNYRTSKLILEEITRQSAIIFAPKFRINAIAFGVVDEADTTSCVAAKQKELLPAEISLKNIAQTIDFLLTCDNLTGQIIYLDNGVHLL